SGQRTGRPDPGGSPGRGPGTLAGTCSWPVPDRFRPRRRAIGVGDLLLVRHGETEWSRAGRHTGRTDLPLTAHGEQQARAVAPLLAGRTIALALTSPLQRAARTAELAGLGAEPDPDLVVWDYGGYEGLTSEQIQAAGHPGWRIFDDGVIPGVGAEATPGETVAQVADRARRVL